MNSIKLYIKKYGFLVIMLALIIVVANVCKRTSSVTLAKYRTSVDGTDSTRVAKWSLSKSSILQGDDIELDSGFRTEILDGSGNWAFQISNDSEVDAAVDLDSTIRIRLDNDSFYRGSADTMNWNFLYSGTKVIDNPISFSIKAYNANIRNLLKYKSPNETISYDEYITKTQEEKANYQQIIDNTVASTNTSISLLDLNSATNLTFVKDNENINSKLIFFYYLDIRFKDIVDAIIDNNDDIVNKLLKLNMNSNSEITFVIDWNVATTSVSGTGDTGVGEYYGYELLETVPEGYSVIKTISLNGKEYNICKTTVKNFFEYQKYTSSLNGGEPRFEFPLETGGVIKVKYSDLTLSQINEIMKYPNLSDIGGTFTNTYTELQQCVEKLHFNEYKRFLDDNELQQQALGYLSYGLRVCIQFNIKIGQVKPEN